MKLYVSYDNQHQSYVDDLSAKLELWGHEICLPEQANRAEHLVDLLKTTDVVIGILSKTTLTNMAVYSDWQWSIVHQHEFNTRLLLLRVDDCLIPAPYTHIPRIDVHTLGKDQALESLKQALENPDKHISKYVTTPDDFRDYLTKTYHEIVKELNFLIIPVGDYKDVLHMPRTYIEHESQAILPNFEQGFELHQHRAFLVGEPGVGKTITLLMKARDAILERLQDSAAPLPLVGNVVTWKALEDTALHIWLSRYSRLPAQKIKHQLEHETCLLLFDGIDDLGSSRGINVNSFDPRERFLRHVNQLPPQHKILITCRTTALADFSDKHSLTGVIALDRLSDVQIEAYLTTNDAAKILYESIQDQTELKQTLHLPLMLGLFAYGYYGNAEAVSALAGLAGGALRDALFDRYILRRFKVAQRHYHRNHEQPPFMLEEIYDILGKVAKHGAIKYGTGEVAFITPEDERYGDWIAVEDMNFGFIGDENTLADEFVRFAADLHLVNVRASGTCTFTHRLMRNYFVCKFCLPVTHKIDTYAIEALGKIADERVPAILLEVMNGKFSDNIQRIARITYEAVTGQRFVNP